MIQGFVENSLLPLASHSPGMEPLVLSNISREPWFLTFWNAIEMLVAYRMDIYLQALGIVKSQAYIDDGNRCSKNSVVVNKLLKYMCIITS